MVHKNGLWIFCLEHTARVSPISMAEIVGCIALVRPIFKNWNFPHRNWGLLRQETAERTAFFSLHRVLLSKVFRGKVNIFSMWPFIVKGILYNRFHGKRLWTLRGLPRPHRWLVAGWRLVVFAWGSNIPHPRWQKLSLSFFWQIQPPPKQIPPTPNTCFPLLTIMDMKKALCPVTYNKKVALAAILNINLELPM